MTTERVSEGEWVPDRDLLAAVAEKRDEVWGAVLGVANGVVARLREGGLPSTTNHRLADWASLAPVIGEALSVRDQVVSALAKLSTAQSGFALAEEPIYDCLLAWLEAPANRGRWLTTAQMHMALKDIAEKRDIAYSCDGARALGQRLPQIIDNLSAFMRVDRRPHGNTYRYSFDLREH